MIKICAKKMTDGCIRLDNIKGIPTINKINTIGFTSEISKEINRIYFGGNFYMYTASDDSEKIYIKHHRFNNFNENKIELKFNENFFVTEEHFNNIIDAIKEIDKYFEDIVDSVKKNMEDNSTNIEITI